jgi:oxygen-independent coproporphyrinogen-3 oxidase
MYVYIHIPFCSRKCLYCDFFSKSGTTEEVRAKYAQALTAEIKTHTISNPQSIYLGGGTPTILGTDNLRIIFDVLSTLGLDSAEVTVEGNPDSLSRELAEALRSFGVNRMSIGVQSFDELELELLGRLHTSGDARQAAHTLQDVFDRFSLDLMYGIPGQTIKTLKASLDCALKLEPDHISAYELTPEPGTPLMDSLKYKSLTLPPEDTVLKMSALVRGTLQAAGYEHYEISNYARPGAQSLHNINYWRRGDYLGLGAGAHSLVNGQRLRNTENIPQYIELINEGKSPVIERTILSEQDIKQEAIFLGLRMTEGISAELMRSQYELDINVASEALVKDGFLKWESGMLSFTERGRSLANPVIVKLLQELKL